MAHSEEQLISTARRRQFVLSRRRTGDSWQQVAEKAKDAFGEENLPAGWDKRYAYKDFARELESLRKENQETAAEVRDLELMRLDEMLKGVWEDATSGDPRAVQKVLNIQERRARFLGLDAPEKFEQAVSVLQDESYQELRTTMMSVLQDFPNARAAIAEVLDSE